MTLVTPTLTVTADNLSSLSDHGPRFDAHHLPRRRARSASRGNHRHPEGRRAQPRRGVVDRRSAGECQLHADDRVGVILPMSIHNLIAVGVLPALFVGATCVAVSA